MRAQHEGQALGSNQRQAPREGVISPLLEFRGPLFDKPVALTLSITDGTPGGIWQCLQTVRLSQLVRGDTCLSSRGWRPGVLLNALQHTGQDSIQPYRTALWLRAPASAVLGTTLG